MLGSIINKFILIIYILFSINNQYNSTLCLLLKFGQYRFNRGKIPVFSPATAERTVHALNL